MGDGFYLAIALLVLGILIFAITHIARRIGRLNTVLIKSRRSLDYALNARANAARDFAACGVLDLAASVLLAQSADECLREGQTPLAHDGLDSVGDEIGAGDGLSRREECESALSRTLRLTVDELVEEEKTGTEERDYSPDSTPEIVEYKGRALHSSKIPSHLALTEEQIRLFSQLHRTRFDVRMARSFHNSHVDQVRRLRRGALVRIFHLAGRAPVPQTIDIDDE
ncbi:MAG: hypothetical protein IKZ87_05160 [Actinomycetaceae bacterium]|nr:hypothetical protein [Actinomycetaceae bacterium]